MDIDAHLHLQMPFRSKYSEGIASSTAPQIDFTSPDLAITEVEGLLLTGKDIHNNADEVWPNLFIGNMEIAENCEELRRRRFTHVLNCAHSFRGGGEIYDGMGITYMGIDAQDSLTYDMSVHFNNGAMGLSLYMQHWKRGVSGCVCQNPNPVYLPAKLRGIKLNYLIIKGKILVHCHVGVSRSATIVLAYLMLKQNMTLVEAIKKVKEGRGVYPNQGFLRQLINLQIQLYGHRN